MIKQDGKNYYAFGETMKLCGISESRLNHIVKVYIPKGSLKVPGLDHLKRHYFSEDMVQEVSRISKLIDYNKVADKKIEIIKKKKDYNLGDYRDYSIEGCLNLIEAVTLLAKEDYIRSYGELMYGNLNPRLKEFFERTVKDCEDFLDMDSLPSSLEISVTRL